MRPAFRKQHSGCACQRPAAMGALCSSAGSGGVTVADAMPPFYVPNAVVDDRQLVSTRAPPPSSMTALGRTLRARPAPQEEPI